MSHYGKRSHNFLTKQLVLEDLQLLTMYTVPRITQNSIQSSLFRAGSMAHKTNTGNMTELTERLTLYIQLSNKQNRHTLAAKW